MSDHRKFVVLCSETVHTVPVGADVHGGRVCQKSGDRKHEFQEQLNRKSLKYNWHDAEVTVLEGPYLREETAGSDK